MPAPEPKQRGDYPYKVSIATRWMDNDAYGHVNNVIYYSFFDTVINRYLIEEGGLDIAEGAVIGLAVQSSCTYLRPIAYPAIVEARLRVVRLGRSSVTYDIAIFEGPSDDAVAQGEFVHVFVDRASRKSTDMPPKLRDALSRLAV